MNGAILFSGHYGSTAQYADWISDATGLPVLNVNDANADPAKYDYLVLGSSVIVFKLTIRKWVRANWADIKNKPVILFTVSGAPAGAKLDGWVANSLPEELTKQMDHVALRGRLEPEKLSWWIRLFLRIGAWLNPDPEASKQEREGFDFVDKSGIEPIVKLVQQYQTVEEATISHQVDPASVTTE